LRKECLLSTSHDKSITETSYVLQTLNAKDTIAKSRYIHETLPALRHEENEQQNIKRRPKNLSEIKVETDTDSLDYLS
jgi:hypothetical protein